MPIGTATCIRQEEEVEYPSPISGFDDFGHIHLGTMPNTRDLGGMPTLDGGRIKKRKLIRSGELHNIATDDAIAVLGEHDVRCVLDLRTAEESEYTPDDDIVLECAEYKHLPVFGASAVGITHSKNIMETIASAAAVATDLRNAVKKSYHEAIFGDMGIKAYKMFLETIADRATEEGAILWHCSAGKDRTGIAAILIEHVLGVSEDDIRKDYLATNIFSSERNKSFPYSMSPVVKRICGIDISPAFCVYRDYFDFLMADIASNCSSLDGYVRDVLGVSDDARNVIKTSYIDR